MIGSPDRVGFAVCDRSIRHIGTRDITYQVVSKHRIDTLLHRASVLLSRPWFAMSGNVFLQKPFTHVGYRGTGLAAITFVSRITTSCTNTEQAQGLGPCHIGRPRRSMSSDGEPSLAAGHAHFEDVVLGAGCAAATHAESLHFKIPKNGVMLTGHEVIDRTLRDPTLHGMK